MTQDGSSAISPFLSTLSYIKPFSESTLFHAFLLRFQPFYEARQGDLRKPKARILVNQIALYYGIELLVDRPNHSV